MSLVERVGDGVLLGIPEQIWSTIPAGTLLMGSDSEANQMESDETPQVEKRIAQSFEAFTTPVTVALYQVVLGRTKHLEDLRQPIVNITWHEACHFCERLSEIQQKIIRQPSEAQWEYFCRANTLFSYWTGEDENELRQAAWVEGETSQPAVVATKAKNNWNLHDVHGNVWEWCQDIYQPYDQPNTGYAKDICRVVRGGSWIHDAKQARSASREAVDPETVADTIGFRLGRFRRLKPLKSNPAEIPTQPGGAGAG